MKKLLLAALLSTSALASQNQPYPDYDNKHILVSEMTIVSKAGGHGSSGVGLSSVSTTIETKSLDSCNSIGEELNRKRKEEHLSHISSFGKYVHVITYYKCVKVGI